MNWWYVADIVIVVLSFPFYSCVVVDMCSQAYFDAKLDYQQKFFETFETISAVGEE